MKLVVKKIDYQNGAYSYQLHNAITNKIVCTTWKDEENAKFIAECVNNMSVVIRAGLHESLMKKVNQILEHNKEKE